MGDTKPKSQSLNLQVPEIAQGQGSCQHVARKDLQNQGGQQGRQSPQSSTAEPLVANAKGDQCGVEKHSSLWSSAVSAVGWSLP